MNRSGSAERNPKNGSGFSRVVVVTGLTLSSKGQIVLPAPMRRRLHLKARSELEI